MAPPAKGTLCSPATAHAHIQEHAWVADLQSFRVSHFLSQESGSPFSIESEEASPVANQKVPVGLTSRTPRNYRPQAAKKVTELDCKINK